MPIVRASGICERGSVLLVPGSPGDHSVFHKLFDLAPPGWLLAAVDLPDHGRAANEPSLALAPFEDDVSRCLAVLPRPCTVVGSSLGAFLLARLLPSSPDVERAILIGGFAAVPPELAVGRAQLADAIESGALKTAEQEELAVRLFLAGEGSSEDDEVVRRLVRDLAGPRVIRACRRLAGLTSQRVPAFATPTLVVHARDDASLPHDLGRELAAQGTNARLVSLPGGSHLPHLTNPRRIAGMVFGTAEDWTGLVHR